MTITDADRHQLHLVLDRVLGTEEAAILMEHLPPVGWADVATKRDLDHLAEVLRAEIRASAAEVRADLAQELAGFRSEVAQEFAAVRSEVAQELAGVRAELAEVRSDGASLRSEVAQLRVEVAQELKQLQARMLLALLTAVGVLATLPTLR